MNRQIPKVTGLSAAEKITALVLLAYPALMISVQGGMNGAFIVMLLIAIGVLILRPAGLPQIVRDRDTVLYLVAMASMSLAIMLSQTYHQHFSAHPYDPASRLLLSVPVFIWLRHARFNIVAAVQYGIPLGAITGLLVGDTTGGRMRTPFLDPIHFGDFELILAVLSLASLDWVGRDKLPLRALKIAGFLAGAFATLQSGTLGAWVAIPFLLAVAIYYGVLRFSAKQSVIAVVIVLVAAVLAYQYSARVRWLIDTPLKREAAMLQGNLDTDLGVRLQLYKAALLLISQNLWFGVGPEGFKEQMDGLQQSGMISPKAAHAGHGEVHNEILSRAVEMGVPGFAAILLAYFVPFWLFARSVRSSFGAVRRAGLLGIFFVTGFLVFGLSLDVLNLTMAIAFYSFTVAVLLAACYNVHHGGHAAARQPE